MGRKIIDGFFTLNEINNGHWSVSAGNITIITDKKYQFRFLLASLSSPMHTIKKDDHRLQLKDEKTSKNVLIFSVKKRKKIKIEEKIHFRHVQFSLSYSKNFKSNFSNTS